MAEPLLEAFDAATTRLESLSGGQDVQMAVRDMTLAFVGFDIDATELEAAASTVAETYGAEILNASVRMAASGDTEAFEAGMAFGMTVRRTLIGAFVYGLLAGELHRDRQATPDED